MKCPACPRKTPDVSVWKSIVQPELFSRFETFASSTLTLQCGSCHTPGSILVKSSSETPLLSINTGETNDDVRQLFGIDVPADIRLLDTFLAEYAANIITPNVMFDRLVESFFIVQDKGKFSALLTYIHDPERRANLQLRYIRSFPEVYSLCCDHPHCFRCQTSGFHHNMTCEEYQAGTTNNKNIVSCSVCWIFLVKGDGCDWVNCVCGKGFEWSTRVNEMKSLRFKHKHGDAASRMSAVILNACNWDGSFPLSPPVGSIFSTEELEEAYFWYSNNREEGEQGRSQLWQKLNPQHTTQKALFFLNKSTTFERALAQAWLHFHPFEQAQAEKINTFCQSISWEALTKSLKPSEIEQIISSPMRQNMLKEYRAYLKLHPALLHSVTVSKVWRSKRCSDFLRSQTKSNEFLCDRISVQYGDSEKLLQSLVLLS